MKVLLTGASGLIGTALRRHFEQLGHQVGRLVRGNPADADPLVWPWQPGLDQVPDQACDWAQAVISLNGSPLAKPWWTKAYRNQIIASRLDSTAALARAIGRSPNPPAVWISASATGYYGDAGETVLTENSPRGQGFLAGLCAKWEAATDAARTSTRVVLARTGLVLAKTGGLQPLILLTQKGLAARLGSGQMFWPWIGLLDHCRAVDFALTNSQLEGPVNFTGPNPARQSQVVEELARQLSRPNRLWAPALAVRAAAGPAADLLLASQRAVPAALTRAGFEFACPTLVGGIGQALGR
ncbi:MAG: TIGR01777 family oxidoreductase [Micrococcales bacterium]|nr:TIGR01777 family oxidoreductase [Micrococcales bacterium]